MLAWDRYQGCSYPVCLCPCSPGYVPSLSSLPPWYREGLAWCSDQSAPFSATGV